MVQVKFELDPYPYKKVSAWRTASLALAMGTNWSRVGSAQQYQGSFR